MLERLKLLWKIIQELYFPTHKMNDDYLCVQELQGNKCIIWKPNPYYFYNQGEIQVSKKTCTHKKLGDNYVFLPLPIYEELFELVNANHKA